MELGHLQLLRDTTVVTRYKTKEAVLERIRKTTEAGNVPSKNKKYYFYYLFRPFFQL